MKTLLKVISIKSEEILASIKIFVPASQNYKYGICFVCRTKKRKKKSDLGLIIILGAEHLSIFE